MFNWIRELLEIKYEFRERKTNIIKDDRVCQSCETLRQQLEIANYEKTQLLSKILKEPDVPKESAPIAITKPRMIPWNVRKQILEQEDREKARAMRNAPKSDSAIQSDVVKAVDVSDLEKDLDIAEQSRQIVG